MIIRQEHVHIGPHIVHYNREPLKQGIDGLTGEMSEVLLLSLSLSGRSHTSKPKAGHSQHELPSTPTRFYMPSARCAPDRSQADTKNETSSRPPYYWRRTCLSCWKYALEPTGFDPLVDSDGFDPLWCKSPNGPQML
jgi:hypothetical protein